MQKKNKTQTGSIAKNFHEGSRTEYLGQYIFTAFGTATLTPHNEDHGIDLNCTLGYKEKNRFFVSNFFFVQIKSNTKTVEYSGNNSVDWLRNLNYPLLYCLIDKNSQRTKVYQTASLIISPSNYQNISSIKYIFDETKDPFSIEYKENINLFSGKPILDFDIKDLENFQNLYSEVLKSWIVLIQRIINDRNSGIPLYDVVRDYETNSPILRTNKTMGNVKNLDLSNINLHQNTLLKSIVRQMHLQSRRMSLEQYTSFMNSAIEFLKQLDLKYYTDDYDSNLGLQQLLDSDKIIAEEIYMRNGFIEIEKIGK